MASRGINKVILVGNLGADPDIRYLPTGGMVTALRLATGEVWKDQDGKQQELTERHRVVFYRRLAEVAAEFLKKGSKMDIFKKPVHVLPMWSAALGRSVETVWPSIMEIQTTASRTGLWSGMDRPVWGPDVTQSFTGRFKDDNDTWQENTVTETFTEWVAVTVYRLVGGSRCAFTEEVYWLEAYSTAGSKNSQLPTAMWIKRPKGQLSHSTARELVMNVINVSQRSPEWRLWAKKNRPGAGTTSGQQSLDPDRYRSRATSAAML